MSGSSALDVQELQQLAPAVRLFQIEGAAPGEIALHFPGEGGTLVVGDALINMGSHGFSFLPAKYCQDARQMRRSLPQLLDCQFERILFAHGTPIVAQARRRLAELLQGETHDAA